MSTRYCPDCAGPNRFHHEDCQHASMVRLTKPEARRVIKLLQDDGRTGSTVLAEKFLPAAGIGS